MFNFNTDLADERRDIFRKANNLEEIPGIETETIEEDQNIKTNRVKIIDNQGAQAIGKPMGTYVTIDIKNLKIAEDAEIQKASEIVTKELKELARDDSRIIFTGFVQGKELDELYSNAYVYTLPSDLEGMPLSLLEAMSYGNCCLVSDIDECSEVVEDKAAIFRKSDIEDLTIKLQCLVENMDIVKKYKNEAADYICSKYSWDDVVRQTTDLYEKKEN